MEISRLGEGVTQIGELKVTRLGRACRLVVRQVGHEFRCKIYLGQYTLFEGRWGLESHAHWKGSLVGFIKQRVLHPHNIKGKARRHARRKGSRKRA